MQIAHGAIADPKNSQWEYEALGILGLLPELHPEQLLARIPFGLQDATAGTETELQVSVAGNRHCVDLPLCIEQSNYFANVVKRSLARETPRRALTQLERFLEENREGIWEHSWVRFPLACLCPRAREILDLDLRRDKGFPELGSRSDLPRFLLQQANGEECLRVPVSYLLKLALVDVVGSQDHWPSALRRLGEALSSHFLSDNSSAETVSFHVVSLSPATGTGRAVARETSLRFLLTQLLVAYANRAFRLAESGQRALVYFSPQPPQRLKELSEIVSDSFYRELIVNPCLAGWDQGESKHQYMLLCHQVLSRSQLHALSKLRDAGIIANNLVILPTTSNISLANNGTHLSLGSRWLSQLRGDRNSGFTHRHEKCLGDLVIKGMEHFLPLFIGTYSAAPYRMDFADFHPEKALNFLPHELDFTHLRMIWRRWKKKARLRFLGHPFTPVGPLWIDRLTSRLLGLKGDFLPDFRLIDYLVALLSTDQSPSLNGEPGNTERLKQDLMDLGVFDKHMAVYLLYRLREHHQSGFCGFEGRQYSVFHELNSDLGEATNLQLLITALTYKLMATGVLTHSDVPDDPFVESERRQIIFATAIGIPVFFVHQKTRNRFLRHILAQTRKVRPSRHYPQYWRVKTREYRAALLRVIRQEGAGLAEMLGVEETLHQLEQRLEYPEASTEGKLTREILRDLNLASPFHASARDFNAAAERYYRERLRTRHLKEALEILVRDLPFAESSLGPDFLAGEKRGGGGAPPDLARYVESLREPLCQEELHTPEILNLIRLTLSLIFLSKQHEEEDGQRSPQNEVAPSSLCGTGDRAGAARTAL